jgi:hypothetical protein
MKIRVFQVNPELDQHHTLFKSYDHAMTSAGQIDPGIYKTVFDGNVDAQDLEDVFAELNFSRPIGYNGHSLSVSDVVEIEGSGLFYCDSFGFKKLENFDVTKAEPITGYRMLVLEPHKVPYEMVFPDGLEYLQQAVGGWIECTFPFDDNAFVIGNEEAKLIGLEGNRHINGQVYAGTLLIAADDGWGGTMDLTDEQIQKYTKRFSIPELISPEEVQNDIWIEIMDFE